MELTKRYRPAEVEAKNYRFWEEGNFFRAAVGVVAVSYTHLRAHET